MPNLNNKSEYFEFSRTQKLPARCPILNRCERRAHTLAIANDWPFEDSINLAELRAPIIRVVGEGPFSAGGRDNFIARGLCPEVQLFESSRAIPGLTGAPTTEGEYDKYWEVQYRVLDTGHFSECSEYVMAESDDAVGAGAEQNAPWWRSNFPWLTDTVLKIVGLVLQALTRR
ncbi:hypothetical protein [Paraburkholderia sp. DGU8]|uniref:hypothetical protein n=1 Tax=Paraburkholderia sp. DGU8 TaxID=3161997 RepID=UPI003466EEF6